MICPFLKELPLVEGKSGWPWTQESKRLPERMPGDLPWPTLTVVTPSYNQGMFIEETIRSVLLQGYPDLEYIIIDGGSTDNSIEIIKKYEKWLSYWESRPDSGQCHAINKGWAKAKPGIWAWLNSDDTYLPGTLGKAVPALKNCREEKLVYANVSNTDENGCHLYYYYGRPLAIGLQRMKFWESWNIPQPTTFFCSELVEKYGGLNENFYLALDYELFIRFSTYVKFKYINDTWATTRIHKQAKTGDWKANKPYFFKEMRAANKKNAHTFAYYNLIYRELWYNFKEAISKNKFIQKLLSNPANFPPYHWGKVLQFGKYSNAECYKQNGWHPAEIYGTWTNGNNACLIIPLQRIKANAVILQVYLKAFLSPGKLECQQVKVIINDHAICNWKVGDHHYHQQTAIIPRQFLKKNWVKIEFLLPNAISPSKVGVDNDQRILGINVRSIELMPLTLNDANNSINYEYQKDLENQKAWGMKKIIFIREVFDWMGTHSAYDPLCRHIDASEYYCSFSIYRKLKPLPSSWQNSFYSFARARINPSPFYNINSLHVEVSALKESRKQHADILHIMYGENNYAVLGRLRKLMKGKLVVTLHQTPEWWEENYRKKQWLSLLDAIIVVSQSQAGYFEQFLPGRVTWIPLGIDTTFFNPGLEQVSRKKGNPRIVFSGHWMRDIKTLSRVVENLINHNPVVKFDFLVPQSRRQDEYFKALEKFPQVCWHSGLTDEQLRAIYRDASLLFIPYLNCTASCALLEAMACGLPIVSSRVGGIPEYTHPSFAELLPVGDIDGFTEAIINLIGNQDKLCEKSFLARKYAEEQFAWNKIAQKTIEVYKQIKDR